MLKLHLTALHLEDADREEPAATRDRLRDHYPKGATRRMTQLGLLVGSALNPLNPGQDDTLVYASGYAETRALESFLDSFPGASPTLFQTSIHPSAVQQILIGRQQPVHTFFPLTGSDRLVEQALTTALLAPTPRVILCGGEERGTWMLANGVASDRTFAFACALSTSPEGAIASLTLSSDPTPAVPGPGLSLADFFDHLRHRRAFSLATASGQQLSLVWS